MCVCVCECPRHAIKAKISANKCSVGVEFVGLTPAEVMSVCTGLKPSKRYLTFKYTTVNIKNAHGNHLHFNVWVYICVSYMFLLVCILCPPHLPPYLSSVGVFKSGITMIYVQYQAKRSESHLRPRLYCCCFLLFP